MLWQYFSSYIWDQNNTDETSNHRMNVSWAEEDDWVLVVKKENKELDVVRNEDQRVKSHKESGWILTPPPCFDGCVIGELSVSPFEDLLIEHPSMSIYRHIDNSTDSKNKTDHNMEINPVNRNRKDIDNKRESNHEQQSRCQSIELYINRPPNKKSNQFSYMRKARDLNNVKKSITLNKANSRCYNNAWSKRHYFTNFSYRR